MSNEQQQYTTESRNEPADTRSATTESTAAIVAVARDKYYSGQAAWLWTRTPGALPPFEVVPLTTALTTEYATDCHFVGYVAHRDGEPVHHQPRITKDQLPEVRGHGFELCYFVMIADVDTPGHQAMTPEQLADARARLAKLMTIGWYSSRAGLRILQPLVRPISPEHFEAAVPGWLDELQAVLGQAWIVDRACQDWTRHFRAPHVIRDGRPTVSEVHIESMTAIGPLRMPPAPQHQRPSEMHRLVARLSAGAGHSPGKVERARRYVAQVPTPACGGGECSRATFHVACVLTRRFGLSPEDARPLLEEWVARGSHKWRPAELERKLRDAAARPADSRQSKAGVP